MIRSLGYAQKTFANAVASAGGDVPWQHIATAFTADGRLDVPRLRNALLRLLHLEPILKSTIVGWPWSPAINEGGLNQLDCLVIELDCSGLTPEEAEAFLLQTAFGNKLLKAMTPLRIIVGSTSLTRHQVVMIGHHFFLDLPGLIRAAHRIVEIYEDPQRSSTDSSASYFEFLSRERNISHRYERDVEYWRNAIADISGPIVRWVLGESTEGAAPRQDLYQKLSPEQTRVLRARISAMKVFGSGYYLAILFQALTSVTQGVPLVSIVHDFRRPPFRGCLGMFGEFVHLRPDLEPSGDERILIGRTNRLMIEALAHALPSAQVATVVPALRERIERGLHPGEVIFNYIDLRRFPREERMVDGVVFSPNRMLSPPRTPEMETGIKLELSVLERTDSTSFCWTHRANSLPEDYVLAVKSAFEAELCR